MKLQLILDLDETLINFVDKSLMLEISEIEKAKYKLIPDNTGNGVFVMRPHVNDLLDFAFENCIVSIWTWAGDEYAREVANILTDGAIHKFANIWSTQHATDAFKTYKTGKDLRHLWYNLNKTNMFPCNTILVDDLDTNTQHPTNKNNSIQVPAFKLYDETATYRDVSSDVELLDVIETLKGVLSDASFCKNANVSPFNTNAMCHNLSLIKEKAKINLSTGGNSQAKNAKPINKWK